MKTILYTTISFFSLLFCLGNGIVLSDTDEGYLPLRTDGPPIGSAHDNDFEHTDDPGDARYAELLGFRDFDTEFMSVRLGELSPGEAIETQRMLNGEKIFLFLTGEALFTLDRLQCPLVRGDVIICRRDTLHGISNVSDGTVRWLEITSLAKPGTWPQYFPDKRFMYSPVSAFREDVHTYLDFDIMQESAEAHEGHGPILFRRLFNTESFETNIHVISHAILPPGSSIGYHQHNTREEVYFVVNGEGQITGNGHRFDVEAGDAALCRLGGAHGIVNDSFDDLELFVFSAAVNKGNVTHERNLGNDLK